MKPVASGPDPAVSGVRVRFLWTTLATLPLAVAVQEATARLGLVTGKGLAA